ncbi:MAG TPA: alpha/beta hydrolase [Stellaceae bacterium]|nr:alpha/beta hydrolase [Stellaceae bacterium]
MSGRPNQHARIFDRSGSVSGPTLRDLMGEGSAILRARLRPRQIRTGPVPRGDGHPVIVLPAFFCSDAMTRGLRAWLAALGYAVEGWGAGVNLGPTTAAVAAAAADRILRISTETTGRKASLVGVSLGGALGRALANAHPDRVRRVITVCSPFRLPTASPLEPIYRALAPLHGSQQRMLAHLSEPPPVPTVAIYSRTDGIVAWRSCVDDPAPNRENVAVNGAHTTMLVNPHTLRVIAERLALP